VAALLTSGPELEDKIKDAIRVSVEALQAALDVRGEELQRLESELSDLQAEVARLKVADDWKTARITELESEIAVLREENEQLKAELARRRGGRPAKAK
jgi:peptidoglycan hydrolase CwlO-like protein